MISSSSIAPPTAGTLPLLTLTDSAGNKMNRIVRIERNILKLIRPFGKRIGSVKQIIPEDELYVTFGKILEDIGRLGEMLRDPEISSVRLVLNPDKIAIAETKRTYTYLSLFGFPVDGIFVNKLLPVELEDSYFDKWCRLQQDQMEHLQKSFLDTRIIPIKHYGKEPIGLACLEELGKEIYGHLAPDEVLSRVNTVSFKKQDGKVVLSIVLPDPDKASLDIGRKDNDLLISADHYSRVFSLPDTLAGTAIEKADYEENRLNIYFSAEKQHSPQVRLKRPPILFRHETHIFVDSEKHEKDIRTMPDSLAYNERLIQDLKTLVDIQFKSSNCSTFCLHHSTAQMELSWKSGATSKHSKPFR